MTKEQKQTYYDELTKLCASLKDKTDDISNCLRANAVAIMTTLIKEGL